MSSITTAAHRHVVAVGVDGSPEATAAARYAADFAARNAWDLWLVSAYQVPPVPAAVVAASMHAARARAATALEDTLTRVRVSPHVRLRTLVQQGPVNAVLRAVCAEVQLVVLGQHHLALLDQVREGDHAAGIIAGASCPVTVVPAAWDPRTTALRPVIVALDGVADAHEALALAFDDAVERRVSVVALHVTSGPRTQSGDTERITELAEIVAGAQQDHPDVSVRIRLVDGPIDQAIVDQSDGASAVVLGRPHRHRLGSWHFSVARSVLDRVACPVTVVAEVQSRPERVAGRRRHALMGQETSA